MAFAEAMSATEGRPAAAGQRVLCAAECAVLCMSMLKDTVSGSKNGPTCGSLAAEVCPGRRFKHVYFRLRLT